MSKIVQPLAGLVVFVFGASWIAFAKELLKSYVYDRILHMLSPYLTPEWVERMFLSVPAIGMLILGLFLFRTTIRQEYGHRISLRRGVLNELGPWILVIGGPVVGIIWLLVRDHTQPPTPSHQLSVPAPPVIAPSAFPTLVPPKREFVKLSASQLLALYDTPGLNRIQSAKLVEPYYGLWIETEATVITVLPDSSPGRTYGYFKDPGGAEIECRFGPDWLNPVSRMQPKDKVKIRGRISTITNTNLFLLECEVPSD